MILSENLFGSKHRVLDRIPEFPKGMTYPIRQYRTDLQLPAWSPSGWSITSYIEGGGNVDPVVIHDRFGRIRYQWKDGYIPSPGEISTVLSSIIERGD